MENNCSNCKHGLKRYNGQKTIVMQVECRRFPPKVIETDGLRQTTDGKFVKDGREITYMFPIIHPVIDPMKKPDYTDRYCGEWEAEESN